MLNDDKQQNKKKLNMAAVNSGKRGLMGLIRQGWNEIPEVMGSSVIALIGLGIGTYGLISYQANDGDNKKYKTRYTVYRPDDPRVATIRKD